MPTNLASELKKSLGADVVRRDAKLVEQLATRLAPKLFKEMMPILATRDAHAFAEQVRHHLDEPGFDEAFAGVLAEAWQRGLIGSQEGDQLHTVAKNIAAECTIERRSGDTEVYTMFAVTVQGAPERLGSLFSSEDGSVKLAQIMKQSGFVAGGADVVVLPALLGPFDLANAMPSAIRHAASSIGLSMLAEDREGALKRAGKTVSGRINADEPGDDFHDEVTGTDIRILLGGYLQKGKRDDLEADALMMALGKFNDAPGYLAARQIDLIDRAKNSLGIGLGRPGTVPRVASDLAFTFMATSLWNSAGSQGFVSADDDGFDPDDLAFFHQDGAITVLAKYGDGVANSDPIPYEMIAGDFEHFIGRLRSIHPAVRMVPLEGDDPVPMVSLRHR